jgi:hypothetical protein
MSNKETWYCAACGSLDIRHDAVAAFNPHTQEFEVVAVLDDTWCEDCLAADDSGNNTGEPAFGIPGETNECAD